MNVLFSNIRKQFSQIVMIVGVLLIGSNSLFGQQNIYKANRTPLTNQEIMDGSLQKIFVDPEINVPNHISISAKSYVKLKVDSNIPPFQWTRTTLKLKITPILPDGNHDYANSYPHTISVEYNPLGNAANFIDLSRHEIINRYGVEVHVENYETLYVSTGAVVNTVEPNVTLELGFEAERYYELTDQSPSVTANIIDDSETAKPLSAFLQWTSLVGALAYEVEWTWLDNYSDTFGQVRQPNQILFTARDFELNSSRIRTQNLHYEIPLVYASGYLIYRVRAVGRFMDDVTKDFYGPWSSGIYEKKTVADWQNSYLSISQHEEEKNWQFHANYAEQGRKKELVNYFDGTLRKRQGVTKNNSEKDVLILSEVIYDTQGRPAIEVLPFGVRGHYLRYFKNQNLNTDGNPYSHLDFDWDNPGGENSCEPLISAMSEAIGSSKYFSKNNDIGNPFRSYVPHAEGYSFSQVEFTPDNTGKVKRKGSVGFTHQLNSGHESKYFYSVPNQEELNRLFGYSVGFVSHYKKNIEVDPNGQVSVTYIDPEGRTIATALAGGAPKPLKPLEDETNQSLHAQMRTDLLNKALATDPDKELDNNELGSSYNYSNHEDVLTLSKQLGVAGNNINHYFTYKVYNREAFRPEICPDPYEFVYDLRIRLRDDCQNDLLDPLDKILGSQNIGSSNGFDDGYDLQPNPLMLNTGNYSLLKELQVNKEVLDTYADHYVKRLTTPGTNCYIDPKDFSPNLDINCTTTCSECMESIGQQHEYVLKQLKALYNIPPANTTLLTINPSTFAVTIQPNQDPLINFGMPIAQDEVDGLRDRFKDDWVNLNNACEQLCGPTFSSSCNVYERSLLNDVSPNGQYGLTGDNNPEIPNPDWSTLSLFQTGNQIIHNGETIQNDWRHPLTPYLDENGQPALVEIENLGGTYEPAVISGANIVPDPEDPGNPEGRIFVRPQDLADVQDFLNNWKNSWAKSLLAYHPEYCYLQYSDKLCGVVKNIPVKQFSNTGVELSSIQKDLTSDEFDGYLQYLDTAAKAQAAGMFNFSSPYVNSVFNNDPYFSTSLVGFEDSNVFNLRKNIMLEALNTQYENNTLNTDGSGGNAKLFHVAVQMVRCNAFQACNFSNINLSTLTQLEKDKIWNTYKNLYIALKEKIKYVFINVYAKSKGCYNGCIDDNSASSITNVIEEYSQVAAVNTYINQNNPTVTTPVTPVLCNNAAAGQYNIKEKRFIPVDFAYDSDIDPNDAIDQLTNNGNYDYYMQTGNCPLINDLNLYLTGLFHDVNIAVPTVSLITNWHTLGQDLSSKLFGEFTGQTTLPLPSSASPAVNMTISGSTLQFAFAPSVYPGAAPMPLTLTLPSGSGLSWSNYALLGTNKWHIVGFNQLYYDHDSSTLTGANPVFGFKVVAKIQVNTSGGGVNVTEVLLTGKTLAKIGECHVEGDDNGSSVGEVLVPGGDNCNVKGKFATALKELIANLQSLGQINNNNYNISNNTVFTSGFLHDFFGVQPGDTVIWKGSSSSSTVCGILINGTPRFEMYFNGTAMTNQNTINNIVIGNLTQQTHAHNIRISFTTPSGAVTYTGAISGGGRYALYLVCCSSCGEWDLNGNGIGDLCDEPGGGNPPTTACSVSIETEQLFEQRIMAVLNYFKQNQTCNGTVCNVGMYSPIQISSVAVMNSFYNDCNLQQRLQAVRDNLVANPNNGPFPVPVAPTHFSITSDTSGATSTFVTLRGADTNDVSALVINNPLANIVTITSLDIISDNKLNITYVDSSGISHSIINISFSFQTKFNYNAILAGPNFCAFIAATNNNNQPNVVACTTSQQIEENFENTYKDVLNFFINNISQTFNGEIFRNIEATSSVPAYTNFVNSNNLQALFQAARTSYQSYDPNYTVPVTLDYVTMQSKALPSSTSGDGYCYIMFHNANPSYNSNSNCTISISKTMTDVSVVTKVDIINSYQAVIYYKDLQNIAQVKTVSFGNTTTVTYNASNGSSSGYGKFWCQFFNPATGNSNRMASPNAHFNNEGLSEFIFSERDDDVPAQNGTISCQCVPQTVEPIACDETAYNNYLNIFGFNTSGMSQVVQGLNVSSLYTREQFCAANLQYLIASYKYYLTKMLIDSVEDINYLTITEFGHTLLNYGYDDIDLVINEYFGYNLHPENNPELLLWREYVNTVYFPKMIGCPPNPMPTYSPPVTLVDPCQEIVNNVSQTYQLNSYNDYIAMLRAKFIQQYISRAMETVVEQFTMVYDDKEYQYTLYDYDQADNLIRTVAPDGVKRFTTDELNQGINHEINTHRTQNLTYENTQLIPGHSFETKYKYNTLNQLVWQSTPDGGERRYAYDAMGRVIASQNSKQANSKIEVGVIRFSYMLYDFLGRTIETGEVHAKKDYRISDEGRLLLNNSPVDEFAPEFLRTEVTKTVYTEDPLVELYPSTLYASELFITENPNNINPVFNSRNRITGIYFYDKYQPLEQKFQEYNNALFYKYDVHGNVKELVTYYTYFRNFDCNPGQIISQEGQTNDCEKHLKRVIYDYDVVSGNVNRLTFQKGKADQYIHKYTYDADSRISKVETSNDGVVWENDAKYQYYIHGPLARLELGDKKVQGIDYAYTLHGWTKVVNGEILKDSKFDLGFDGATDSDTRTNDAFGFSLSYYKGDYRAIEGDNGGTEFLPLALSRDGNGFNSNELFNGNVKQMVTSIRKKEQELLRSQKNNYFYDQLNRIARMDSWSVKDESYEPSYGSEYLYDRNGNIQNLLRSAPDENYQIMKMDDLAYDYLPGNNKLALIHDNVVGNFTTDLKDQVEQLAAIGITYNINDIGSHNYIYDELGQLIEDRTERLYFEWRVDGKVKSVKKGEGEKITLTYFDYDGLGNRIAKRMQQNANITTTFYAKDAQGNVLGIYNFNERQGREGRQNKLFLKEHNIYGSSRLGIQESNLLVFSNSNFFHGKAASAAKEGFQNTVLSGTVPVFRDYSLEVGLNTVSLWPLQPSGTTTLEGSLSKLMLDTRFKLNNPGSLANNEYAIAQLQYKGTTVSAAETNLYITNNVPCLDILLNVGSPAVTHKRISNCSVSSVTTTQQILAPGENGYIQYTMPSGAAAQDNHTGFKINNIFYGFRGNTGGQGSYYIEARAGTYTGFAATVSASSVLKIRRFQNDITYFINGVLVYAYTITNGSTYPANYTLIFPHDANRNDNLIIIKDGTGTNQVTNQVQLSVLKNASGYTPIAKVTQYVTNTSNVTEKRTATINGPTVNGAAIANGITYLLDSNIGSGSGTVTVNGVSQNITPTFLSAGTGFTPPTVAANGANQIGGVIGGLQKASFSMCYFNYGLNHGLTNGLTQSFGFDDVTSQTVTNNPPKASQNPSLQMSVTPSVVRTLGPCLPDTDQDGIFDIYEDISASGFLDDDDTDNDGTPNYLDPDDDGDGVLTIHEGADPDGNHNPNTGTPSWNTDGNTSGNPNVVSDNIPNYLDSDDDGDGYATWEEGANPDGDGNPYTGATLDTDGDGIPDYLDYTDGIYPAVLEIMYKNFMNVAGDKRYELYNHLGNVLSVITDKKIPFEEHHFNADIIAYNDYYPFGMLVPNRYHNSPEYRYAFNGMEKDEDIKEEGNSYDFGARLYDPRAARFLTTDPMASVFPNMSPFVYAANTPLIAKDEDGKFANLIIKYGIDVGINIITQMLTAYMFDDNVKSIGDAWDKVSLWDAATEGLVDQLGTKKLKMAANATLGIVNYLDKAGKNATFQGAMAAGGMGLLEPLIGDAIEKYGLKAVTKGLKKLGLDSETIYRYTGQMACFVADTEIATQAGLIPIQDVKEGDLVWSFNEETGKKELKAVTKTFSKATEQLIEITVEGSTSIVATPEHPFYLDGLWVAAKGLKVGDKLVNIEGKPATVTNVKVIAQKATVFNFEVEHNNTYFVSKSGYLVHNRCIYDQWREAIASGVGSKTFKSWKSASAAKLDRNLGGKVGDALDAHHILPLDILVNNKVLRAAAEQGFDINSAANGILINKLVHNGNHKLWSESVDAYITANRRSFKGTDKEFIEKEVLPYFRNLAEKAKKTNTPLNQVAPKITTQ